MRNSERSLLARVAFYGLLFLVAACGGSGDKSVKLADLNGDGQIVVLCFGDSITVGVGDGAAANVAPSSPGGYPARLQSLLAGHSAVPLVIINDGVSGETTDEGRERLETELEANKPDYVILLEGAESRHPHVETPPAQGESPPAQGESPHQLQASQSPLEGEQAQLSFSDTHEMLEAIRDSGAKPLLGTLTPNCCDDRSRLPEADIIAFNTRLRTLGPNEGAAVIDFYSAFTGGADTPYDSTLGLIHDPEGFHPTTAGYDLMAITAREVFIGHQVVPGERPLE